jgi:tryptophanyl-tRNA synthetase
MRRLMNEPAEMDRILLAGVEKAQSIAAPILAETKRLVGFWSPKRNA